MNGNFILPPAGFGPGSQPVGEDEALDYMAMPSGMRSYASHVPEVDDTAAIPGALALLSQIAAACERVADGAVPVALPLGPLTRAERRVVADALGSGEVSLRLGPVAAQESVFAGVWTVTGDGQDRIEVAPVPMPALDWAFDPQAPAQRRDTPLNPGVFNAPPLLTELLDRAAQYRIGDPVHAINLTLLPHTPEDLDWLDAALGTGSARFLSRGYGNCTVTATAVAPVWRVRFYNSTDQLILDSLEVTGMPEVVLAAAVDLQDSADRLRQVQEAMA